ncbi:MAG: hypothetical protein HKO69_03855 [Woeseiaceae bacterium]|nr:hypothetical protein [Woeseiaceae bacterium]
MSKEKLNNAKDRAKARSLLPLVALGGGLAATPVAALELGDIAVQSNLGQPLRASIAYALAPNEMLSNTCLSISAGPTTSGLPGIGASSIRITERAIMISGLSPIREPMLAARVTIDCPYTPNLSREYMLLVDPADMAVSRTAAPVANVPAARPEAAPVSRPVAETPIERAPVSNAPAQRAAVSNTPAQRAAASSTPARRAPVSSAPIGQSTRYQVQPGDSLSEIVARIENRSVRLWPAVNMVFAANPDAFIDNDPNKLKAGSWLTIPSLDGTAPVVNAAAPEPVSSPAEVSAPAADTSASAEEVVTAYESAAFDEAGRAAEEPVVTDSTADLMPGDTVAELPVAQEPVTQAPVTPAAETVVIPDTELEGPQTTSASPNVPTAIVSTGSRNESTSLLMWLIGGGLALILALLLFGRRARERFSTEPAADAMADVDARYDDETVVGSGDITSEEAMLVESAMHFDIDDDSPTDENLALDADLAVGTGLEEGEMAVAHDFGFAQTTELDIELPFEPDSAEDGRVSIVEPISGDMEVESILENEVLPELDDEGEMSIISETLETVKMRLPEQDETTPDLEMIDPLNPPDLGSVTIEQEQGLSMLEQDYEDELTATQALNREIERAAAQLKGDLDPGAIDLVAGEATEETAALPLATVTELDATAELRRKEAEETAEYEAAYDPADTSAVTVSMPSDEETSRMPVANDDDTVEMDIESGKVDTRKRSRKR